MAAPRPPRPNSTRLAFAALLLPAALLLCSPARADKPVIHVGIVPQQSALALARSWGPLLQYLGRPCALDLQFETAPDIPSFERRVAKGLYDLVYFNPLHYVQFHDSVGYQALAREKDTKLVGLIVVRKDSPIQDVRQLEGKTLALPAPEAFAASVLPRAELDAMGVHVGVRYVGSHDSVYLAVRQGLFPAGGGINRTWSQQPDAVRQELRILWQTPPHTPHAFATRPGMPDSQRQCLLQAMTHLPDTPEGQALLQHVNLKPLTAARDEDWNDIRRLGIRYQAPAER
ncbi:phosphate/phosphite/phosphonate ABC transporter substrate-binding protein [Chromobacterium paludis]|uniref:Phosphate/phosphite/phosphonate ABC transporter substrate-binding protein n=1 Tax=Chromobacterium paludis TaxID=2605945 RepID=A0A5C1DDU8_9NEIS|nr:phosphate/phosphite/phosphonate ABC transporter substrate-binding protein [Chromobacterium paludis]QEL54856.1 phosphate/phosphite/phosphonate ABC transporter substrate-binding protein [Chromobacterium paludis]